MSSGIGSGTSTECIGNLKPHTLRVLYRMRIISPSKHQRTLSWPTASALRVGDFYGGAMCTQDYAATVNTRNLHCFHFFSKAPFLYSCLPLLLSMPPSCFAAPCTRFEREGESRIGRLSGCPSGIRLVRLSLSLVYTARACCFDCPAYSQLKTRLVGSFSLGSLL
jgi:hypothetical protein